MSIIKIGVVTISDRASNGIYKDISGPALIKILNNYLLSKWKCIYKIIPDEVEIIQQHLIQLADKNKCSLIFTTGGTGPSKRDVTPEATVAICDKILPGFGELMRMTSVQLVPTAILSRQTAGTRGQSLIVNLPGNPNSIKVCLDAIFPAIPYCIELLEGPILECNNEFIKVFRPKK